MRSGLLLCALDILVGCNTSDRSPNTAAKATPSVASTPVKAGGSMVPASAAESLVTEFVKRDAAGERLRASSWFDSVVTEADQEGGYDSFTAIKGFKVGGGTTDGDTVKVPVHYVLVGAMQQVVDGAKTTGMRFVPHDSTENEVFSVVRQRGKWKIVTPEIDQHVLASAILGNTTLPALSADDRQRLVAVATP